MAPVPNRHKGKVAIVTGAGQGIGRGIATRLSQEGATVVIAEFNSDNAREAAADVDSHAGQGVAYPIDIGDVDQIQTMVDTVVEQFGHIDILVNNAGVLHTMPLDEITPDEWDWLQRVNQRGLFFCLQRVAVQMRKQVEQGISLGMPPASIVNLSSVAGRSGRPYAAHYSAAKWAVISITQSAAEWLAPLGITVNAICPGIVETPMWEDIDRIQSERFGLEPGGWIEKSVNELVPLRRAARAAEDIGATVSFLCSDDGAYVTGQAINVAGGMEMN
ncbi:MAG: SDR family oxidoreductase [Anaerolineaceae bacterium]|nr:SDR family oxidoreductase [Anaerolineaceae bacterium]